MTSPVRSGINTKFNSSCLLVVSEGGAEVDVEGVRDVDGVLDGHEDGADLSGRVEPFPTLLHLQSVQGVKLYPQLLSQTKPYVQHIREGLKKSGSVMEIFHKGSDPPPPYFRKLWNR